MSIGSIGGGLESRKEEEKEGKKKEEGGREKDGRRSRERRRKRRRREKGRRGTRGGSNQQNNTKVHLVPLPSPQCNHKLGQPGLLTFYA